MSSPNLAEAFDTQKPTLRLLADKQAEAIHEASTRVLEETGYHIPVEEARRLLKNAGAKVDGQRVYIDRSLVERALKTVRAAVVFDRNEKSVIQKGKVAYGAAGDTFYVIDPFEQKARPFLKSDIRWIASVINELPNIDWLFYAGNAHDVPSESQIPVAVKEGLRATHKPIMAYPADRNSLLEVIDILYAEAGGKESFRKRPFFFCGSAPAAPLNGTDYNIEAILICAEHEIPLLTFALPAMGANSPCNITGHIVLANADWLGALVIHQLKNPGAPICNAGFSAQVMDMRTMVWSYSSPEVHLACAITADLSHWYGLPAMGMVMEPDTPHLDAQAGVEMASHSLWAELSGVEIVRCLGRTGAGKMISAEAVILADEIIRYTRAALRTVSFSETLLSQNIDLINQVGPFGNYIGTVDTLKNCRGFWYPQVFERSHFDPLAYHEDQTLLDRLNNKAKSIINANI